MSEDLKTRAAALLRSCTPDPYASSHAQALQEAARSKEALILIVQAACPPGVRYRGPQTLGTRSVHVFQPEAAGATSFSIIPEYLSAERIAAELQAAEAKMRRQSAEVRP